MAPYAAASSSSPTIPGSAELNALERMADAYASDIGYLKAEIAVKQGPLRDYESRIGRPFAHEGYMRELTDLRDQLRLGLSEHPLEGGVPVAELAEQIRALRAGNEVEAAPERVGPGRQPGQSGPSRLGFETGWASSP
jgi:hypothetical protein